MTLFGVAALALTLVALLISPRKALPWVLSASTAFPATMMFSLGGNAFAPFYVFASIATVVAVFAWLLHRREVDRPERVTRPGLIAGLIFVAWTCVVTAVGPIIFEGAPTLSPRGLTDQEVFDPTPLTHSVSNFAQIAYLLVSIGVIVYFTRNSAISPFLPALGFGLGVGLSLAAYVFGRLGIPWPDEFFSNSIGVRYISFTSEGVSRFRGIFAEPSQLAGAAIPAMAFFVSMVAHVRGAVRLLAIAMSAVSAYVLVLSYAGTALAGTALLAVVCVAYWAYRIVVMRTKVSPWMVLAAIGAFLAFLALAGRIVPPVLGLLTGKLEGRSFDLRAANADFSIDLAFDTFLVGVGLGSNRPTSFFPMLLSNVGIIGTVAFIAAIAALIFAAFKNPMYRPAAWALISMLCIRVFVGGVLSSPAMWLCIAVLAHAAWSSRRPNADGAALMPASSFSIAPSRQAAPRALRV